MSITLGGERSSLKQHFENLLECADNLFTLVLVIGDELYQTVQREVNRKFSSNYINKPRIIKMQINTRSQLSTYGITQWSPNTQLNATIATYLKDRTPFIFYRDGSICNVHTADKCMTAVEEICELFRS